MAYSGRCLISNYLTHRDANRGNCTQPCRWKYTLQEETRPGVYFPIEEDDRGAFLMSSKDLAMIEHLDALAEAGIDSIKIEGRVKSAYYVATVVNAYRQVLDGAIAQEFLPELDAVSHRPYHTGFFFGPAEQSYEGAEYLQTHDWVATVQSCETSEDGSAHVVVSQRNRFFEGDDLEVLSPGFPVRKVRVRDLRTAFGQLCEVANRACDTYGFESAIPLLPHDLLRRKREDIATKG